MQDQGWIIHTLPNADQIRQELLHPQPDTADPQPAPRKILVVDDQKLVADTVCAVLEHAGFQTCAAYSATSALNLALSFRPDALLSDVLMPGMDGVKLAITFRQLYPEARIVLFSGQAGVSDILESAQRDGHHFEVLAKPIHPATLIQHLTQP